MSDDQELSQSQKDIAILDHHVKILRDKFESVQIFAVRHEEKEKRTITATSGGGNWYVDMDLLNAG